MLLQTNTLKAQRQSTAAWANGHLHVLPLALALEEFCSQADLLPAYWVQISGASALAVKELSSPSYDVGLPSSVVYDDLEGIDEIRSLIRAHPVRAMDNYLLDVSKTTPNVKTAIVLPPIIYGKGEGPGNQRSIQIPSLCRVTLERGHVVRAGQGLNRWGSIHVKDIARLFTALAQEAHEGRRDDGLWNDNGIYLSNAGEMVSSPCQRHHRPSNARINLKQSFAEISDRVSHAGLDKGFIQDPQVEVLSKSESDKVLPGGSVFFGSNARGHSRRATELFGWRPVEEGLDKEVPRALEEEFSRRG